MTRALATSKQAQTTGFTADHSWRQQNHIWNEDEVQERMATADMKHVPQNMADSVLQRVVRVAYHTFNFMTGYDHVNPPEHGGFGAAKGGARRLPHVQLHDRLRPCQSARTWRIRCCKGWCASPTTRSTS